MHYNYITYFNWNELFKLSRRDVAAILCLAYAQTKVYNELSTKTLLNKLKLNHIPAFLFHARIFSQNSFSLTCKYKTNEPQSYFKNPRFLFMMATPRHKAVYLKALSLRRISDRQDFIPLKYYEDIEYNPFIKIENDKIYFPLEEQANKHLFIQGETNGNLGNS